MTLKSDPLSIIMLGASGAVESTTLNKLLQQKNIKQLTLLDQKTIPNIEKDFVKQQQINIFDGTSYQKYMVNNTVAICTLGVGEPSKISKKEFIKIDKPAVLNFAIECKKGGVKHFEEFYPSRISWINRFELL